MCGDASSHFWKIEFAGWRLEKQTKQMAIRRAVLWNNKTANTWKDKTKIVETEEQITV
jgi:hypothetical protein